MTTSTGKSAYDGLQVGFTGRGSGGSRWAAATRCREPTTTTPTTAAARRPTSSTSTTSTSYSSVGSAHRFAVNAVTMLPCGVQASAIFFVGSPRPINVGTNLDPFGLGYNGRWLDATGTTLPRYSERTGCDACFPVTAERRRDAGERVGLGSEARPAVCEVGEGAAHDVPGHAGHLQRAEHQ